MKKLWITLLFCLCCATALADFDPVHSAHGALTEIYGYTAEEADAFCYEKRGENELVFSAPDHSEWVYVLTYNQFGVVTCETPFHTTFQSYPGENSVREFLRQADEGKWFINWSDDYVRNCAYAALLNGGIHPARDLSLALAEADTPIDQVVNAFFTSCYGDPVHWPDALISWRDAVLAQYGATLTEINDIPAAGILRYQITRGINYSETTVTEFQGEIPEQLQGVFSAEPHLAGWTCLTGTMFLPVNDSDPRKAEFGYALTAFERNGQRMLVGLDRAGGSWNLYPIGTSGLLQDPELKLSITGGQESGVHFTIHYYSDDGMQTFDVNVTDSTDEVRGHYCVFSTVAYQAVSSFGQDRVAINMEYNRYNEWTITEQHGDQVEKAVVVVHFPAVLGVADLAAMPRSIAEARSMPDLLPEGYAMTAQVHLRKDHSSRSDKLGTLEMGTLIPVQDTIPGDPFPWIKTTVGQMKGYVCEQYTSASGEASFSANHAIPLAVAQAQRDIALKSGTGWFDRTVQQLPAGTRMRVIMDKGDWYYVVVPRPEYTSDWLMDVDGTYGYVKKAEVQVGTLGIQLDWACQ